MFQEILKIAILCIVIGSASIPISFTINSSPVIVWLGNGLGSFLSAFVVIYIGDRVTNQKFKDKVSKHRVGKKVVSVFDEGDSNKHVLKARMSINKHGLKVFAFLCPIFPGVLISTATVYLLDLDKRTYKRWMFAGVFFASGAYVFAYWFTFVKPH
jgi:formate/nitrite transporter FocA (FNT family)